MKKNHSHRVQKRAGIALLIAIVIAALVVLIGIALATIATKELALSGTLTDSEAAYYSAKTGADCAKYFILNSTKFDGGTGEQITCNGTATNIIVNGATESFDFQMKTGTADVPYVVHVDVTKDQSGTYEVTSHGFNVDENGNRRVERVETSTVKKSGFCADSADLLVAVDLSGSISSDALTKIKASLKKLVANINVSDTEVHMGIIVFDENASFILHLPKLGQPETKQDVDTAIDTIELSNSSTNIKDGVDAAISEFSDPTRDRPDETNSDILLIISDGVPTKTDGISRPDNDTQEYIEDRMADVEQSANEAKGPTNNINIFTLGIMDEEDSDHNYVPPVDDEGSERGRRPFMRGLATSADQYYDASYGATELPTLEDGVENLSGSCSAGGSQ